MGWRRMGKDKTTDRDRERHRENENKGRQTDRETEGGRAVSGPCTVSDVYFILQ